MTEATVDNLIERYREKEDFPGLLLHSCCGPCSTYCIEYLSASLPVTVFFYNPNIFPRDEYEFRKKEQKRFIEEFPAVNRVDLVECDYDSESFYRRIRGLENEPEGGSRCKECFSLRLNKTAEYARDNGFLYFATTLTLSPLKNAGLINEIGSKIGRIRGISYVNSNFKKKNGYLRSTILSKEYGMYRQSFCGCEYSMTTDEYQSKYLKASSI